MRFFVVLALLCGVAYADDKPWAANVTKAQQDEAFKVYDEANNLFAQGDYKKALERYDAAIALWDHPGIRYNRAVCLINLDRTVDAYQDLEAALKYGEEPLGKDLYNQGLNYQKLLSKQVAEVEISMKEHGAKVSLDGKPLELTAGSMTTLVATNAPHEITASKPGYQTFRKPLERLPAGQRTTIEIHLEALEHARWKPWAVVAGGAIVSSVGVYFYSVARGQIDDYEKAIATTCPCASDAELGDAVNLPDRAHRNEVISYSLLAVGGATLVTGAVLVIRGRGHTSRVTPSATRDTVGMSFSGTW